jgi:hypothetical protein
VRAEAKRRRPWKRTPSWVHYSSSKHRHRSRAKLCSLPSYAVRVRRTWSAAGLPTYTLTACRSVLPLLLHVRRSSAVQCRHATDGWAGGPADTKPAGIVTAINLVVRAPPGRLILYCTSHVVRRVIRVSWCRQINGARTHATQLAAQAADAYVESSLLLPVAARCGVLFLDLDPVPPATGRGVPAPPHFPYPETRVQSSRAVTSYLGRSLSVMYCCFSSSSE